MDGLIILDNNGRPIIMSNFRNHPPSYPLVHVDSFNDALSKTQEAGNTKSLDPVLYVSNTMQPSLCFHVESGGLRFLCPASEDVDPVYVFTFLQTFLTILKEYLHDISLSTLKDHFDVVYQLLEEMLDDGKPMTTEPNALRDIVLPPSFFDKILNVAGVSGLPSMTPTPFSSPIPWRKQGVKYNNNEIYFDIAEEIEAIVGRNGSLLSSEIWGNIKCNCRLSGTPDLILSFTNPKVMLDPSFHSCVRLQKYQQTSALSFVPPDGNFVLMDYRVLASATPALKTVSAVSSTQLQLQLIPLILKPVIELGEKGGTINITLTPRTLAQLRHGLEDVVISLFLGNSATSATCHVSYSSGGQGAGGVQDREKIEKASGTWTWIPKEKIIKWTIKSMKATTSTATWSLKATFTCSEVTPRPGRAVQLTYRAPLMLISGLKVDQLRITGESYKPYKGVRVSSGGSIEWRW